MSIRSFGWCPLVTSETRKAMLQSEDQCSRNAKREIVHGNGSGSETETLELDEFTIYQPQNGTNGGGQPSCPEMATVMITYISRINPDQFTKSS